VRLEDRVAGRDAAVFVGRDRELAVLGRMLEDDSGHRVAFVTGPAGIGKSALLRALARRATRVDLLVVDPGDDGVPQALADLPGTTRVVVASRRPPDAGWWSSPWAASLLVLPLEPLPSRTAAELLAVRGVAEPDEVSSLVAWAEGHPLSLTLAAAARVTWDRPLRPDDLAALDQDLLDHVTDGLQASQDVLARDRVVLATAALAPAVDAALLAAVLPGTDGSTAERWLRGLAFAVPLGARVTLAPRVRRLLAAQLRRTEPDLERSLRLRIIDHLSQGAAAASTQLVLDIREVLNPPQDRGIAPSRALSGPWLVDTVGPGDADEVDRLLEPADPAYRAWVARWIERAPECVTVVRRATDPGAPLVALAVGTTQDGLPEEFRTDPAMRRWASWVAARDPRAPALLTPVTEVWAEPEEESEVAALLLASLVQRCAAPNFRFWLVPRRPPVPDPAHCGGVADPALDLVLGRERLAGFAIDYGPDGVVAAMRHEAHAAWAATALVTAADVRDALREVGEPVGAGRSPYAGRLPEALEHAFGEGPEARLLRSVVELGYLDPEAGHVHAMRELHLSRTTYFRRLREAVALMAEWLSANPHPTPRP
jgi:hypothetical protein